MLSGYFLIFAIIAFSIGLNVWKFKSTTGLKRQLKTLKKELENSKSNIDASVQKEMNDLKAKNTALQERIDYLEMFKQKPIDK